MSKKLIAFDLDDTLSVSKTQITDRMSSLLGELLQRFDICIISGGSIDQFHRQVIDHLDVPKHLLGKLHLMPTCGTRYYRYDELGDKWVMQYANDLSKDQKQRVISALEQVAKELKIWCENPAGDIIEDRFSQITMSALGQQATPEVKYAWAKKYEDVRPIYRDKVSQLVPDVEVRIGGTTSTDVTLPGIDKAFGMTKLIEAIDISKDEILFFGDKLEEGENDFPVKNMGIDSIAVEGWETTAYALEGILGVS